MIAAGGAATAADVKPTAATVDSIRVRRFNERVPPAGQFFTVGILAPFP